MNEKHTNAPPEGNAPPPLDLRRAAAGIICAAAGGFVLWLTLRYALGIALPFLLAWLLSRPVKPLAGILAGRTGLKRNAWAAGLVILTVGGFVTLAAGGIRRGIQELSHLIENTAGLTAVVENALAQVRSLTSRIPLLRHRENTPGYEELYARIDRLVEDGIDRVVGSVSARLPDAAMTVAGWIPSAFIFVTVTLLACYYFSADDGRLSRSAGKWIRRITPTGLQDYLSPLGRRLRRIGQQYLRACLLLGLLTFLQIFIGLALLRVPYAFILAFLIALVDFLPLLGTGIILLPWAAVCLLLGKLRLGIGLLILYAVSSVVRQILEPKLIGEGLGLHPLVSLAAMYAGLRLFGVWGMILAPLVTAGVKSMLTKGE